MIPRATLRLQFHQGFTFADAEALVPYFARLGVSHLYASPIAVARPGSLHGYDVIDPTRVNPELGGEAALRSLAARLAAAGLGLIVDIVPNHMAADTANAWWADVLRHGRASRYARFFDIDWDGGRQGRAADPGQAAGGDAGGGRDRGGAGDAALLLAIACRWRPAARVRSATCWNASTIAWPGGAAPATASTGGASSTSTSWSACAWRSRKSSKPCTPCRFAFMPRA